MVLTATWLAVLTLVPGLQAEPLALAITGAALIVNGITSFAVLLFHKHIPFLLNLLQILLFAMAHGQIFLVCGPDYYQANRATDMFDWQLFTWLHALSAADLVHFLESYGWSVNPIQPRSVLAGVLLVIMHWNVSLFVVSILVRWGGRLWRKILQGSEKKTLDRPEQLRRLARWKVRLKRWQLRGLLLALAAFALSAGLEQWRPIDWLLWPLDNILRTIDLGDTMGVFQWRWHAVERTFWVGTLGIFFRLLVGSYVARWLHALHVGWLGSRALRPLEDYILDLTDDNEKVRAAAAQALGEIGSAAREAVAALVQTVDDEDGPVVRITRQALAIIGPPAENLVPELIGQLAHPNWAVRRAAVEALGRMGPAAQAALPALVERLADPDRTLEKMAARALERIDPAWPSNSLAGAGIAGLVRRLEDRDCRLRQRAADGLGRLGPTARAALPDLLARLKDREEYVRLSAAWAMDRIDPTWRLQVFVV